MVKVMIIGSGHNAGITARIKSALVGTAIVVVNETNTDITGFDIESYFHDELQHISLIDQLKPEVEPPLKQNPFWVTQGRHKKGRRSKY